MDKKISVLCCVIGAGGMTYGGMNFEFQGIDSPLMAITVSISLALGGAMFLWGAYSFFKGEDKTTTANKGEKPMMTAKQLEKANKKKEKKTIGSVSNTSVELMKRELELFDRKKEFEKLVSEIKSELAEVQEKISSKGWTAKEDGSWTIGK
jgi:hypothetical protein|tara:strand:+ start:560 stop:1012 length:453 start_codon:yes stop_codon:yes gene_type:complete